ncbi:Dual specificity protein phosphatase 12 [Giardia lamblia P15]|uniref:Dual specificity protein phosphatase 12 n=1 Tax=Giardia intestinalis (strain P15) TaxID=658858 RepID=E1F853_GIAIA|nr:Dual specificity protein phosphatase 12 [Giardia lamblia P15]
MSQTRYVGIFRCNKCSTPLFLEEHVQQHESVAKVAFRRQQAPEARCSSYFLPKLRWMGDLLGNQGNLACPRCAQRVGGWCWSGRACTCGGLVVPYIAVHRNKVDRVMTEVPAEDAPTAAGAP